eukprot:11611-Heterococcus_DN1.PRE.6
MTLLLWWCTQHHGITEAHYNGCTRLLAQSHSDNTASAAHPGRAVCSSATNSLSSSSASR